MSKYTGSEWVIGHFENKPDFRISEFGKEVADLLGMLFRGIYHIGRSVNNADWSGERSIFITLSYHELATTDGDELTKLVFLAHHYCIRVAIEAVAPGRLRISFHRRNRDGDYSSRHSTLSEAVIAFDEGMLKSGIKEYQEAK